MFRNNWNILVGKSAMFAGVLSKEESSSVFGMPLAAELGRSSTLLNHPRSLAVEVDPLSLLK